VAVVLAVAAWTARSQEVPPVSTGTTPAAGPAAAPAKDGANGEAAKPAPAPVGELLDENFVLAAVNRDVVTVRDVLIEWKLEGRRQANPDRPFAPTKEDRIAIAKSIVMDKLWIAHARQNPMYAEFVTPREIDLEARGLHGALFDDPSVTPDEREVMRRDGERSIAMQIALETDPEFRRCKVARPEDIRYWYDSHPELHRRATMVKMGRVLLGRQNAKELYGEPAESLVVRLRQRAVELSSLEAAAKELAPGSYVPTRDYDVEHEADLREDVLQFAKSGVPGDLSPPIPGESSIMLFTVIGREEGHDVTLEQAAPEIKKRLQALRCRVRGAQYFVAKVLPEAFFVPQDLFDDEISDFVPGFKRARAEAAARAQQGR
jgi:hypothetical protein